MIIGLVITDRSINRLKHHWIGVSFGVVASTGTSAAPFKSSVALFKSSAAPFKSSVALFKSSAALSNVAIPESYPSPIKPNQARTQVSTYPTLHAISRTSPHTANDFLRSLLTPFLNRNYFRIPMWYLDTRHASSWWCRTAASEVARSPDNRKNRQAGATRWSITLQETVKPSRKAAERKTELAPTSPFIYSELSI